MAATQGTCTPVDSLSAFYPLHQRSEAAKSLPPMGDIAIQEFYKLIGQPPRELAKVEGGQEANKNRGRSPKTQEVLEEQSEQQATKPEPPFSRLNAFVDVLESCLNGLENNALSTEKRGSNAPAGHITSTQARPDIVIFRKEYSLENLEDKVYWGSIEMAIEFHSAGKSISTRTNQAVTYVMYLLEARPDLVSALGLLVEKDSLVFFFCNAAGIGKLSLSNEDDYLPLLSAVMRYLNDGQTKNLDPTLSRVTNDVAFNVAVPGAPTAFSSCKLRYSHDPFGRRPHVFIHDPKTGVAAIRVIKDQYIRKNRRWTEKEILEKIHINGTYPAVVRMCFYGEITQATCGNRSRVRICLQDYGTDFLSLKTPRDVIYALYDLLEVTRSLYFDCDILHRDISPYNIMIRDSRFTEDIATRSSASPIFIRHLLNAEVPKHKSSIFLIDFGYSQDLKSSEARNKGRTGTPIFIARAVQADKPLPHSRYMVFPELPRLSESIEAAYVSSYPKRLELFNGAFTPQIGPCTNPPSSPFRHKLEHDGESGVWCSFWWSLLAFPENTVQVPINPTYWTALMPRYEGSRMELPLADVRDTNLHALIDQAQTMFNPGYEGLRDLFGSIAEAIMPDYHWAEDTIRQKPDFVHEILQRIILNFVAENKNATFMDKRKADRNRTVHGITDTPHLSTPHTDSRCALSMAPPDARQAASKRSSASRQTASKRSSASLRASSRGTSASRQATSKRSSASLRASSMGSSTSLRASSRGTSASRQATSKRSSTSLRASSMGSSASNQSRKRKLNEKISDTTPPIPSVANTDEFSDSQSDCDDDPNDEETQRFEKKPRTDDVPDINVHME